MDAWGPSRLTLTSEDVVPDPLGDALLLSDDPLLPDVLPSGATLWAPELPLPWTPGPVTASRSDVLAPGPSCETEEELPPGPSEEPEEKSLPEVPVDVVVPDRNVPSTILASPSRVWVDA